jgi:hypothetical protein
MLEQLAADERPNNYEDLLVTLWRMAADGFAKADIALNIQLKFGLLFRGVAEEELDSSFARNYARLAKACLACNEFGMWRVKRYKRKAAHD